LVLRCPTLPILCPYTTLFRSVFNIDGEFYAIEDVCTHDGAEIASGTLDGSEIVCPRHGARFCVKTGKVLKAPAYTDLVSFPVRRSEEHTSELQSRENLVCRLL